MPEDLSIGLFECYYDITARFLQSEQSTIDKAEQRGSCNVFYDLVLESADGHFHQLPFESHHISATLRWGRLWLRLLKRGVSKNLWTYFKTTTRTFCVGREKQPGRV